MLITFRSSAWSNITLFGDIAVTLLKMMGHSGTVPSALLAADIPSALAHLGQALDAAEPAEKSARPRPDDDIPDTDAPVGLRLRAYPLIQLLTAAERQGCDVTWSDEPPVIPG